MEPQLLNFGQMILERLYLLQFKNIREMSLEMAPKANCFLGENGEGKTNILDAIHYLSFTKSYFNQIDNQNINHNEDYFVVQGWYQLNGEGLEIYCGLKRGQKKNFKKNKKEYERLADHIGILPLVMVSPSDADLINEGSEVRRKFIDSIISQYDKVYLERLIDYNKVLLQRNALLKRFAETRSYSADLLDVWDIKLSELGRWIYEKRKQFLSEFIVLFNRYFALLSGGKEEVGIDYKSDLAEYDFYALLKSNLHKDRSAEYTTAGIHKDDLIFMMNDHPVKKFGSQGQQKSYLIALKLAQYKHISTLKQTLPILLLDDIFDKLDVKRVAGLMKIVTSEDFGQLFITDTDPEKLPALLEELGVTFKTYFIKEGGLA